MVRVVPKGRIWMDLKGGVGIHWVRLRVTSLEDCKVSWHKESWGDVRVEVPSVNVLLTPLLGCDFPAVSLYLQ